MPEFAYIALESSGAERRGRLPALDRGDAAEQLRRERLCVLSIRPHRPRPERVRLPAWRARHPKGTSLEAFLRQLAVMLEAGLTLIQGLDACAAATAPRAVRAAARRLGKAVREGSSFSVALDDPPGLLSQSALERVRSAEVTGELDAALRAIAGDLERGRLVRSKLWAALAYPLVVLAAALGVTALLVLRVVPRFATFFVRTGKPMPPSLRMLVEASEAVAALAPWLLALAALSAAAAMVLRRAPSGRLALDRFLLGLPVVGGLLARHALWRTASSLSGLLGAGIAVLPSLRLSAGACGNAVLADALERSAARVLEGEDLAAALAHPVMPSEFLQVVSVGERSGELGRVLAHLASHYERQVDQALTRLSGLLEPVLLLVVGGLVGVIYIAFFQAIFRIAGG